MANTSCNDPEIVEQDPWRRARATVHETERKFDRSRDGLKESRRRLPMTEVGRNLQVKDSNGEHRLLNLFEGQRQLMLYHFWFEAGGAPCEGCSMWTRALGDLGGGFAYLHEKDTTLAFVSAATPPEIAAIKAERGWQMPWYSLPDERLNEATGYDGWAQISIFLRAGETVYLTNTVPFGDLVTIGNHWTLLERTPLGLRRS